MAQLSALNSLFSTAGYTPGFAGNGAAPIDATVTPQGFGLPADGASISPASLDFGGGPLSFNASPLLQNLGMDPVQAQVYELEMEIEVLMQELQQAQQSNDPNSVQSLQNQLQNLQTQLGDLTGNSAAPSLSSPAVGSGGYSSGGGGGGYAGDSASGGGGGYAGSSSGGSTGGVASSGSTGSAPVSGGVPVPPPGNSGPGLQKAVQVAEQAAQMEAQNHNYSYTQAAGARTNNGRGPVTTGQNTFDCSGFVGAVYKAAGLPDPYGNTNYAGTSFDIPKNGNSNMRPVSEQNAVPGDVVVFPDHIALYIGKGQCVSMGQQGDPKVVSVASEASYNNRGVQGFYHPVGATAGSSSQHK